MRSALLFVDANQLPEVSIAYPPFTEGIVAKKEWPPTILGDTKTRLAEKLADEVAALSASQKVHAIPNYRDLAQIQQGIKRYQDNCLFPGEEEEDTNYQEALAFQREYEAKLGKRVEGIKKDMAAAIESGRQMDLAVAIRDFKDADIQDDDGMLQAAEAGLRDDSSVKELKVLPDIGKEEWKCFCFSCRKKMYCDLPS